MGRARSFRSTSSIESACEPRAGLSVGDNVGIPIRVFAAAHQKVHVPWQHGQRQMVLFFALFVSHSVSVDRSSTVSLYSSCHGGVFFSSFSFQARLRAARGPVFGAPEKRSNLRVVAAS